MESKTWENHNTLIPLMVHVHDKLKLEMTNDIQQ